MSVQSMNEMLNNTFLYSNREKEIEIYLNDLFDFAFYDNIEEFIDDHDYLLNEKQNTKDIISNPSLFKDLMNFLNNNIKYSDQIEELFYIRAKNNDDAEHHLYLMKSLNTSKDNILKLLNGIIKEYDNNSILKLK